MKGNWGATFLRVFVVGDVRGVLIEIEEFPQLKFTVIQTQKSFVYLRIQQFSIFNEFPD